MIKYRNTTYKYEIHVKIGLTDHFDVCERNRMLILNDSHDI